MENISEELRNFVNESRGQYSFNFKKSTTIQEDLNVWGDDAVEFIEEFGKTFNVDISEFNYNKYFRPEGDMIMVTILRIFRKTKTYEFTPLTLGDLEQAIKTGKLL